MSTHPVYASVGELAALVGQPVGQDDRLALALVMASRWVDRVVGYNGAFPIEDPAFTGYAYAMEAFVAGEPIDATFISPPITVVVTPSDIGIRNASLVAAVRFLRSPDAPFSVLGGLGDLAIRVNMDIPEAEAHLLGLRRSWGVA